VHKNNTAQRILSDLAKQIQMQTKQAGKGEAICIQQCVSWSTAGWLTQIQESGYNTSILRTYLKNSDYLPQILCNLGDLGGDSLFVNASSFGRRKRELEQSHLGLGAATAEPQTIQESHSRL
jgi:uncharacterized protein (DUF1501 family)